MAVREAPSIEPEVAPDVRGPTAPLPAAILVLGIASLVVIALGLVVSQLNYALSDRVLTQNCLDEQISPSDNGAIGVCNIVEALADPLTTGAVYLGIGLGAVALVLGAATYRRMDNKRRRDQAITGAVLGTQAVAPGRWPSCGSGRPPPGCSRSTSSTSQISRGTEARSSGVPGTP